MKDTNELISAQGFLDAYFVNLKIHDTQIEAYDATEKQYEEKYGAGRRYASYNSFRIIKNRQMKAN